MTEILMNRRFSRLAALLGLALAGASAQAQDAPSPAVTGAATQGYPGGAPDAQAAESAPSAPRSRGEIHPYLEVAQTLTADLNGGDTLTYTSFAVGVDGHVETRRIAAQFGVRYQQNVEWSGDLANNSILSGTAQAHLEVVPNLLSFDMGALATHTAGEGQALGATVQDASVNVYSVYAGPTLSTQVGALAVNAAYRFGYTTIDDDRAFGTLDDQYDSATAHSLTASVGMGTNAGLPFGWTIGGGYGREDSGGDFGNRFEMAYIRGDVVFPVSPTFALTAGIGYEDIEASQRDFVRDASGNVVIGPNGLPVPDPNAPRLLTYDMDDIMYDAGFIWRPGPRTELQARAGHRYGGTTFTGSLAHQLNNHEAINAVVFDTVETFGRRVAINISALPDNADIDIDPLTGNLSGCVFGQTGGGVCLADTLQTISPSTFRARGGSLIFAGSRGLWSYGTGASYTHHDYHLPASALNTQFVSEDEIFGISASLGRQLTRVSNVNVSAYASWYEADLAALRDVTTVGSTISYDHRFMLDRLQLLAAMGLYNSDNGIVDSANFSAMVGLRYTFW